MAGVKVLLQSPDYSMLYVFEHYKHHYYFMETWKGPSLEDVQILTRSVASARFDALKNEGAVVAATYNWKAELETIQKFEDAFPV